MAWRASSLGTRCRCLGIKGMEESYRLPDGEAALPPRGSRLLSRYDAPITECWPHLDVSESRFAQHLRYLLPGILFAFRPSEHDHAERCDWEWSRLLIVIEHLVNENVTSGESRRSSVRGLVMPIEAVRLDYFLSRRESVLEVWVWCSLLSFLCLR